MGTFAADGHKQAGSLDEFHLRKMHPGEAIFLLLHDLKQLLGQAMPKLEVNAQEQLLLHQFLAGLPESVSSQLQATGETKSLEDVVERYEFCWCHCSH